MMCLCGLQGIQHRHRGATGEGEVPGYQHRHLCPQVWNWQPIQSQFGHSTATHHQRGRKYCKNCHVFTSKPRYFIFCVKGYENLDDKCGIVFNQQNVYSNVQILKIKHQNVRAASYTINNTNVGFLICPHMIF